MNRNYIYLTILMLLLAFGTLVFKKKNELQQIEPQELLREMVQPTRYMTTDQVAELIIHGDPALLMIDVRPASDYENFALPGSVNIPLDSLVNESSLLYFGIPGMNVVFVSNDDIVADQAWVLTKRLGYNSIYVMKGGLNNWMATIIDPQEPATEDGYSAYETYLFRKGAQLYFTGSGNEEMETTKLNVDVQRRQRSDVAAGGC